MTVGATSACHPGKAAAIGSARRSRRDGRRPAASSGALAARQISWCCGEGTGLLCNVAVKFTRADQPAAACGVNWAAAVTGIQSISGGPACHVVEAW